MKGYRILTSPYKTVYRLKKKGFLGFYYYVCSFSCGKDQDLEVEALKEVEAMTGANIKIKDF